MFQETKVGSTMKDLEDCLLHIDGYESFWSLCTRKSGYSGVATFVKKGLTVDARREFGRPEFDCEGRVMMTDHGSFLLFNVYFPNSGNGDRLDYKMEFYKWFESVCDEYLKQGRQIVIAGDVNTTHGEIDIWCPDKLKQGLFDVERKWMDHFFSERTNLEPFVDTFRALHPTSIKYSWWDVKSNLRITDQGYRLDYFMVNKSFMRQIVESDMMTDQLGSDHCPLFLILKPQKVPPTTKLHPLSSEKVRASQPKISSFFSVASKKSLSPKSQITPDASPSSSLSTASVSKPAAPSNGVKEAIPSATGAFSTPTTTSTETGDSSEDSSTTTTSKEHREKRERTMEVADAPQEEDAPEAKRPKLAEVPLS